jgi:hypothetical protein
MKNLSTRRVFNGSDVTDASRFHDAADEPTNGASPGTSAAADGAKTRAAVANPAIAIFFIFISTNQNGLTVV